MHNETLVVYHLQKFPENPISKWNTTFWVVGSCGKNSGSNRTSQKVVLFFRTECYKRKFVFHFFKANFDTSSRLSRPFFGNWNRFVQTENAIPERNFQS